MQKYQQIQQSMWPLQAKNTIHENYFHPGPSTSKFQGTQKSNHPTCPPGEEWCAPPTQAYGCWPTHICP